MKRILHVKVGVKTIEENIILVLLIFLSLQAQAFSIVFTGEIYTCSDYEVDSQILFYTEFSNISICCTYKNATMNENLTLVLPQSSENYSKATMTRINASTVKLEIENAVRTEKENYSCMLDNLQAAFKYIKIYELPEKPSIMGFVCTYDKILTVTFDRGASSLKYELFDEYEVTMVEYNRRPVVLCKQNSTYNVNGVCKNSVRQCVCQFADNKNFRPFYNDPSPYNVTITVRVRRYSHTAVTEGNFSMMANFVPESLKRLNMVNVTSRDAFVQFCLSDRTYKHLGDIKRAGSTLSYHMYVIRNQGIPESLNVTLPSTPGNRCVRVHLPNLTAYTKYTVIVFASGGGGQGDKNKVDFQTEMTVPVYPPQMDPFGFLRTTEGDLIVLWRNLPHAAQGGSNLSYIVNISSDHLWSKQQIVTEIFAFFSVKELHKTRLRVRIWAQNVVGLTSNYTELEVSGDTDKKYKVHCEFNGDNASVYVHVNGNKDVAQIGIHWCKNYSVIHGVIMCLEYPETIFFNVTKEEVMQFDITLTRKNNNPEISEDREIQYTPLCFLNVTPSSFNTTFATVTYNAQENQILENDKLYHDNFDHDNDIYYYDYCEEDNNRKKRDIGNTVGNSLRKTDSYPVVFTSLKRQDGVTISGMIPVDCYFDRNLEDVDVRRGKVEYDESYISVQWNQRCDPKLPPTQFKASYFIITPSMNEHCSEKGTDVDTDKQPVCDKLNQYVVTELPRPVQFMCFQAHQNSSNKHKNISIPVAEDISPVNHTGAIVGGVIGSVCLVTYLGMFIYYCIRRRNYFLKMEAFSLLDLNQNTATVRRPRKITVVSQKSNTLNSEDSGRGTAPCPVANGSANCQSDSANGYKNCTSAEISNTDTTIKNASEDSQINAEISNSDTTFEDESSCYQHNQAVISEQQEALKKSGFSLKMKNAQSTDTEEN